jgi:hypothetical protein
VHHVGFTVLIYLESLKIHFLGGNLAYIEWRYGLPTFLAYKVFVGLGCFGI